MNQKENEARLMKIVTSMILAVLVVIAGLLISLQFKLNRVLSAGPQPPEAGPPAVASLATDNLASKPAEAPSPAAARPARRPTSPPAAELHYTQGGGEIALPEPELTPVEPAPVETITPQPSLVTPPSSRTILPAPAPSEPEREQVTIPAGAILTIRLVDPLNSQQNRRGDRFTATLDEPIWANGLVVAPRGSTVEGRVLDSRQAGRVSGLSEMTLELDRLLLRDGRFVEIVTDALTKQGEASRGQDMAKIGSGAAIGATIGAVVGGRRGAGIGAAIGSGATTTQVMLSRGKPVLLPPETRLSFHLRAPLHVEMSLAETSSVYSEDAPRTRFSGDWRDREESGRSIIPIRIGTARIRSTVNVKLL